jgi:hypothetical protein
MGDAKNDYDCLNRVACEEPKKAREYITAAKMLIKGARIFNTWVWKSAYSKVMNAQAYNNILGQGNGKVVKTA